MKRVSKKNFFPLYDRCGRPRAWILHSVHFDTLSQNKRGLETSTAEKQIKHLKHCIPHLKNEPKKGLLVGFWKWQFVHCLGKSDCDKQ